jgi:hypothetical protein
MNLLKFLRWFSTESTSCVLNTRKLRWFVYWSLRLVGLTHKNAFWGIGYYYRFSTIPFVCEWKRGRLACRKGIADASHLNGLAAVRHQKRPFKKSGKLYQNLLLFWFFLTQHQNNLIYQILLIIFWFIRFFWRPSEKPEIFWRSSEKKVLHVKQLYLTYPLSVK